MCLLFQGFSIYEHDENLFNNLNYIFFLNPEYFRMYFVPQFKDNLFLITLLIWGEKDKLNG